MNTVTDPAEASPMRPACVINRRSAVMFSLSCLRVTAPKTAVGRDPMPLTAIIGRFPAHEVFSAAPSVGPSAALRPLHPNDAGHGVIPDLDRDGRILGSQFITSQPFETDI